MKQWDVIYQYCPTHIDCETHSYYRVAPRRHKSLKARLAAAYVIDVRTILGYALFAMGLGGIFGPLIPQIRMETAYHASQAKIAIKNEVIAPKKELPKSVPVVFEPLMTPDGSSIDPVDTQFGLVVPKIGINSRIIPGVDPTSSAGYTNALQAGVAHANTSFYPDEDGTVYLFSHSTNYDWFVKDLNAVFYLLKDVEKNDTVVIMYKGKRYTYKITDKKIVSPSSISYIVPYAGKRNLILQTCWPPGSITERLLIFADLIEENGRTI